MYPTGTKGHFSVPGHATSQDKSFTPGWSHQPGLKISLVPGAIFPGIRAWSGPWIKGLFSTSGGTVDTVVVHHLFGVMWYLLWPSLPSHSFLGRRMGVGSRPGSLIAWSLYGAEGHNPGHQGRSTLLVWMAFSLSPLSWIPIL